MPSTRPAISAKARTPSRRGSGAAGARSRACLAKVQSFDPPGVGARDLAECLAIQLKERDRFDPAMAALVGRLDLVAKRDHAALKRICGVDDEDLADMLRELRGLEPKPGRAFGGAPLQVLVPDVFVRAAPDGRWLIELNTETLPRVLVNQTYYARVSRAAKNDTEKTFLTECLQTANWLTRSLEQRAKTILKVATEIVRQQDGFFAHGVEHLRPLNLKTMADAIGMHESTVSRVTSNKSIGTSRGTFEMKYFFTASIAGTPGERGALGRGGAPPHPPDDRRRNGRRRPVGRCASCTSCGMRASTSPAARWPSIVNRCAFPRRSSGGATRMAAPPAPRAAELACPSCNAEV